MTDEFVSEDSLATMLGMTRESLRKMRPQNSRVKKNLVEWPLYVATATALILGLDLPPLPETNPPSEVLTVSSVPGRDGYHFGRHLIKARRHSGEEVTVRVIDSKKFAPTLRGGQPMVFRAVKAEAGNWWLLRGREPRWKGMW